MAPPLEFAFKLHSMLEQADREDRSDIISWTASGEAFSIVDRKAFEKELLPIYFRHGNIRSFQRNLQIYGFKRVATGVDKGAYFHELFLKKSPELCQSISRQPKKSKGPKSTASKRTKKSSQQQLGVTHNVQQDQQALLGHEMFKRRLSAQHASAVMGNPFHQQTMPSVSSAALPMFLPGGGGASQQLPNHAAMASLPFHPNFPAGMFDRMRGVPASYGGANDGSNSNNGMMGHPSSPSLPNAFDDTVRWLYAGGYNQTDLLQMLSTLSPVSNLAASPPPQLATQDIQDVLLARSVEQQQHQGHVSSTGMGPSDFLAASQGRLLASAASVLPPQNLQPNLSISTDSTMMMDHEFKQQQQHQRESGAYDPSAFYQQQGSSLRNSTARSEVMKGSLRALMDEVGSGGGGDNQDTNLGLIDPEEHQQQPDGQHFSSL